MKKYDELDIEIIKILQKDGRMSFREIGEILNKPESTIRTRYNNMHKEGLINVVAIPDLRGVGWEVYGVILLKVELKKLKEVAEKLAEFPEVRYVAYTSGAYDITLQLFMETKDELLEFMTTKLASVDGIVKSDLLLELKFYKNRFDWLK